MGRRAALWLVLPLIGLVLACAFAPAAEAATYTLRPNVTHAAGTWLVEPVGGTHHGVLADPVRSPTLPSTTTDYIHQSATGDQTMQFGFADHGIRPGEQVTRIRVHGYLRTGSARTLDAGVTALGTTLGGGTVSEGYGPGWLFYERVGSLTQAEVDDLRLRLTSRGNAATSTATQVYASYMELTTDMPVAAPAITGGPGSIGNDPAPAWSFTDGGSHAAGFECRLDQGATIVSAWAACTSAKSYDLAPTGDGSYTFRVRAVDDLGAAGPETSSAYTLDRVAPSTPTIDSGPPAHSSDPLVAWAFTGEAGAFHSCRLIRDGTTVSGWTLCSSPASYDLSGEADGAYTFEVASTDLAGNTSGTATASFTLDRAPPAAPVITAAPPATGNSLTPAWSFTHEAGAGASCRLDRGATIVVGWEPCASPKAWDLTGEADGTYTFRVFVTDAAGNESDEAVGTYVLDTDEPAAPTITGGPEGPTNVATPTFTFTHEASTQAQCRLRRGTTIVSNWTNCDVSQGYDLTAQPDGDYTFAVRATDPAGNTGPEATRSFTLDRSAPAAPVITGGPAPSSSDVAPSYSFTHEAGATASCRLTRGATVVSDWVDCTSPKGYDLSSEIDGTYTFHVRATDAGGNTSAEATRDYVLDRVAPDPPTITGRPASISNDDTPTWSFSASPDATKFRCRLQRGTTVISDYAACTSPRTYDLTGEPDGTYTFTVRAVDDANNESAETSDTYTLDRVAPPAPTITSGPTGSSQDAMPSYAFTAEAGTSTTCRMERGGTVVSNWGPCVSPRSYDLTLHPDGTYTFRVRATDTAGNTGPESTRTYTLDRTAPAAPVVTSGPPPASSDAAPQFAFTGEAGATFACRLERGATAISDWSACSSPRGYDLSDQVDGTYTFRVRATDAAGNTSADGTWSYTLDRQPPPAPVITSTPGAHTNSSSPAWGFTSESGTTTACRIERGATVVSDWASCASPRSYDLSAQPDGTYTFRVRATDAAQNTGPEASHTTAVDRVAPAAPVLTGAPLAATADPTPAFTFTYEDGATASCRLERDGTVVSGWSTCASPRSYDLTAEADGVYTFRVRATDAAQNTSAETTSTFTLDRVAPNQPLIITRPPAETNQTSLTWSWTGDPSATTHFCRITQGATVVFDWAVCTSPWTYDFAALPDGTYTFRVRSSDPAGNISTEANDSFALDRVPPAAPTITAGPTGESQDQTPAYSFSSEMGTTTACRMERGATVVSDWSACASPRSYDLALQPDGTYTFRVRATDAAGNTGAESARSYTLDRTAPAAPVITSAPVGDQQDDTPTYAWTAEVGSSSTCRVQRGDDVVSDWAACSTPHTHDLSAEPDGTYEFLVRATDAAGNTSASASQTYTLDRTPPDAPAIDSAPATHSTDDSPTYGFSAEAGATFECRMEGATLVEDWAACTSPRTYGISGEPDGTYTFAVRATDAAGNTGPAATHVYTLDRTVPAAPVIDARPGDDGNDRTPEWAFSTTEPDKVFECRLARGTTLIADWGPCVSPREWNLNLEPDGTYTFGVRAVNLAGTRSLGTTDFYRLDTAAPAAPEISGGPAADSTDDTPEWAITPEPGATLECRLERGDDVVSDWASCSTPQGYDLSGEVDGTYTFLARATDAAGNTGDPASVSYTLDRTVPLEPVLDATPPPAGSDPAPTWEFSGEPGKTFECRLSHDGDVVADWAPCTSPHTLDLSSEPDGTYTLDIRAINPAQTRSPVTSSDYELDRVTPVAPVITDGPPADSSDGAPAWSFTGESRATFECRVERGDDVVDGWRSCTSPDITDLGAEPDGTYTFRVRQTDPAGNTSPDASRSYTLDRTVPDAPVIETRPVSPGFDQTPEWEFSGTAGLTLECRLTRGDDVVSAWAPCTTPRTYDLSSEPDAGYTFTVRQYNAAGTRGPEASDEYELDVTAPLAPAITASPGPVGNSDTPQWSFTAEAGAAVECRLDRGAVSVRPWAPCTSPRTYGLAGEPDGDYTFSVRATDAAGNTGPATTDDHRLDRVAPAPPTVTDSPGPLGRDRNPAWAFTAEEGAVLECTLERSGGTVVPFAVCVSPHSYDLTGEPDGSYAFGVRARDAAGNTSPATPSPYVLDTTPGGVEILGGPGPLGRDRNPAWRFSGEEGASFECRLSLRGVAVADWGPCVSPHGFDLGGRPDGVFAFSLRATDPAGNVGPAGEADYELDTTPPAAPSIDRRPETPGEDRTPTWRFSGEANATFACRVEGTASRTVLDWTLCASPFTADLVRSGDGDYRFLVRATDLAGNTGEPAAGRYELTSPKPSGDDDGGGGGEGRTAEAPVAGTSGGPLTAKPSRPGGVRRRREAPAAATPKPKRTDRGKPAPPRRPERRMTPPSRAPAESGSEAVDEGEGNFATRAVRDAVNAIVGNPDKSVFPLSLLLLVLGFLAIQNRIDRSDPKLALAPTFADPDLEFRPPPGDDQ